MDKRVTYLVSFNKGDASCCAAPEGKTCTEVCEFICGYRPSECYANFSFWLGVDAEGV
jgi:hypothetical protein